MLNKLFNSISFSPVFLSAKTHLERGEGFSLELNNPSARALFLSVLFKEISGPVAVVCENEESAEAISSDCLSLLGGNVFYFPDYKKDASSVPGFVSRNRILFTQSFNALLSEKPGVFISSDSATKCLTTSPKDHDEDSLLCVVGAEMSMDIVLDKLTLWKYERVDHSHLPNTFARRGGILDVFSLYAKDPIRIEYFGNKIDSVRTYNPTTQISYKNHSRVLLRPPAIRRRKQRSTLSDSLALCCVCVLYITESSVSFLSGDNKIDVFVDPLSFEGLSSSIQEKGVDRIFRQFSLGSVFLFNPLGKLFPRKDEMVEIPTSLRSGFSLPSFGVACFAVRGKGASTQKPFVGFDSNKQYERVSSLSDLSWGDFLVHVDYGVGVYRGLEAVGAGGAREENIKIEYSGGGSVFVPISRFNRVHKYIGMGGGVPKVARLGSGLWEKQKALTKKSAEEVVGHLVNIYQARSKPRGFRYVKSNSLMRKLEDSFPFQETAGQLEAIKEINNDLDQKNPMDRLVYGDVGFGKTEVALRAAMRVVLSGKVAFFLSPTTVLSDQHYITCKNRLGALGVNVELLSRFRTKKEQSLILERLHNKKIDLLVGTHSLLSDDVSTENLGLLIVDEEHRFGVKHKEHIRRLKNRVDVLTLTATPIPRTLQQSLVGIRDTSKIETPPQNRLSILTEVLSFNWSYIKKPIQKEIDRGGQVYFLHNDIKTLPFLLDKIVSFFPLARVAVGHGQMSSKQLEKTILSFFDGNIDILICTTIIESGLDVPNANTIIINNAHKFGLSQLYQIRGRVGRGERQAFCFLCVPPGVALLPDAYQRLKAIEYYSDLGSGYQIAMKDLEIRGAGNLFGYEQSGQISNVGFELYNKILGQAVLEKRGEGSPEKREKISVIYSGSAQINKEYMPLVQDRLYFYQKISVATTVGAIGAVKNEIIDRFGPLREETKNLFSIANFQCALYSYPFSKCKISRTEFSIDLEAVPSGMRPQLFFERLRKVFYSNPYPFKVITGRSGVLVLSFKTSSLFESFSFSKKFVELFSRVAEG